MKISDQEQEEKPLEDNGFGNKEKEPASPLISPVAWAKRTPDPDRTAFYELAYDLGYMLCVLSPMFILFFLIIKWSTDFRIPNDVFIYSNPLTQIFFMCIHGLIIKSYPYLAKINKPVALLFVKIIPVLVAFGIWGKLVSS
jgi:hypothetical protein